jgi:hypothetical protein
VITLKGDYPCNLIDYDADLTKAIERRGLPQE